MTAVTASGASVRWDCGRDGAAHSLGGRCRFPCEQCGAQRGEATHPGPILARPLGSRSTLARIHPSVWPPILHPCGHPFFHPCILQPPSFLLSCLSPILLSSFVASLLPPSDPSTHPSSLHPGLHPSMHPSICLPPFHLPTYPSLHLSTLSFKGHLSSHLSTSVRSPPPHKHEEWP